MNRKFLLLLMIASAMLIAVIGQHQSTGQMQTQLDSTPWQVDRLNNGAFRVFGITLGKTSIQEANQIFASFAKTRLLVDTRNKDIKHYQLIASYQELVFSGLVAQIDIQYQLKQDELHRLYTKLKTSSLDNTEQRVYEFKLSSEDEMSYLSTPVASITYTPSTDLGFDTILQRFGPPSDDKVITDEQRVLDFPKMGLKIYIYKNSPDQFIYSALN